MGASALVATQKKIAFTKATWVYLPTLSGQMQSKHLFLCAFTVVKSISNFFFFQKKKIIAKSRRAKGNFIALFNAGKT